MAKKRQNVDFFDYIIILNDEFSEPNLMSQVLINTNRIILSRTSRGFNLTELLVVISILSLLIALLSPSLRKAMESAHMGSCAKNVQSQMLVTHLFLQDNDDTFWDQRIFNKNKDAPRTADAQAYDMEEYYESRDLAASQVVVAQSPNVWGSHKPILSEYLGGLESFACPSFEPMDPELADDYETFRYAYLFSRAYDSYSINGFTNSPDRLAAVVDGHDRDHYESGVVQDYVDVFSRAGQLMARHKMGTNTGYLDGHVEWKGFEDFIPVEVQDDLGFQIDQEPRTLSWGKMWVNKVNTEMLPNYPNNPLNTK